MDYYYLPESIFLDFDCFLNILMEDFSSQSTEEKRCICNWTILQNASHELTDARIVRLNNFELYYEPLVQKIKRIRDVARRNYPTLTNDWRLYRGE